MATKVKVYSNDNVTIVGSLQNYLLQHGIHAEMRNQYTSSVMGEAAFFDAWPELWVLESEFSETKELLDQIAGSQTAKPVGPDWICKYCRESNPGNFELCWQCTKPH